MLNNNISVEEYLQNKGVKLIKKEGAEIVCHCVFSGCDNDSKGSEAHLYINPEGLYQCKKCGVEGNFITLQKHFGDYVEKPKKNLRKLTPTMVESYHKNLPDRIKSYLINERGLSQEIITQAELGFASFHGQNWITIPIRDLDGNYKFLKLRQDPEKGKDKRSWPTGESDAEIYDWSQSFSYKEGDKIVICEGEMDALVMRSYGHKAITGTHGATTFKQKWIPQLKKEAEYFICYDNDDAGKAGSQKVAEMLHASGFEKINIITLPPEVGEKGDITDYVVKLKLPLGDLFTKYSKCYPEKISTSEFREMGIEDVNNILSDVIKKDDENKAIAFLAMLTTYTDDSQMNVMFNAPSSTGKSHIPMSIKEFFPKVDIQVISYCSPTAFFHEQETVQTIEGNLVDLSKKILIFLDMPDTTLLTKLRPLLSHDEKIIKNKITDKNSSGGNQTKQVLLKGYPTVFFCSANSRMDEQESTRFIVLSPSLDEEKVKAGIKLAVNKNSDRRLFANKLLGNEKREELKKRILAIKQANIFDVKILDQKKVEDKFLKEKNGVKPRAQRDVVKVIGLIKGLSLLNLWLRERDGNCIIASDNDIETAFELWNKISVGQDYGLSAYTYNIYKKIILPLWEEKKNKEGPEKEITRMDVIKKHVKIFGTQISPSTLRQQILPQLEASSLIMQEYTFSHPREKVIFLVESEISIDVESLTATQWEEVSGKNTSVENVAVEQPKMF